MKDNLAVRPPDADEESITCIAFNQDHTHLAVGWRHVWSIYRLAPFALCQGAACGASTVEMLFSSSLVALVGCGERAGDSPRRLRLWNTSTSSPVFELTFASDVLNVLMNRTRLLVILAHATHIFELVTQLASHPTQDLAISALPS